MKQELLGGRESPIGDMDGETEAWCSWMQPSGMGEDSSLSPNPSLNPACWQGTQECVPPLQAHRAASSLLPLAAEEEGAEVRGEAAVVEGEEIGLGKAKSRWELLH